MIADIQGTFKVNGIHVLIGWYTRGHQISLLYGHEIIALWWMNSDKTYMSQIWKNIPVVNQEHLILVSANNW